MGSAASGKTTGAKIDCKKIWFKVFYPQDCLYRYACYLLIKYRPKNNITFFEKQNLKQLTIKKLNNINCSLTKINEHTSIIAKQKKIRLILKKFQINFAKT